MMMLPASVLLEGETVYQLEKAPYHGGGKTGKDYNLKEIRLLAPVEPSVLAVGFNYHSLRRYGIAPSSLYF